MIVVKMFGGAHLFNFVGDGLKKARASVLAQRIRLANWPPLSQLKADLTERGFCI